MGAFQQMLIKLGLSVHKSMKPVLDRNAGGLARDLAKITPPLVGGKMGTGGTAQAYYAGEKSLRNDIYTAFKDIKSVPFASFIKGRQYRAAELYKFQFENPKLAKAYRAGKWNEIYTAFAKSPNASKFPAVRNLSIVEEPTQAVHNSLRDKRGKVKKGTQPVLVVRGQSSIDKYFNKTKRQIGVMVSGWVWVASRLKAMVPTNWTGRSPKGNIVYSSTKTEQKITISNPQGNFNGYFDANRSYVNLSLRHWMNKCKQESEAILKKEFEKARNKAAGINPPKQQGE